jgi:hypothetical protein
MLRRSRSMSDLSDYSADGGGQKDDITTTKEFTSTPSSPAYSTHSVGSTRPNSSRSSTSSNVHLEVSNRNHLIQGYNTPISDVSTNNTNNNIGTTPFSLQFQNHQVMRRRGEKGGRKGRGRGQPHYMYKQPITAFSLSIMRISAGCLTFLSFIVIAIILLFTWEREIRMAPNECIEFPENPLYTPIPVLFKMDASSPPYRLMHVYPQGSPDGIGRPLTDKEIWNSDAPVLFVPGHGGSYNQTKASAAQALVESRSLHGGVRLNFFAIDTLEVPSGLAAELLWSQANFINICIKTILKEYEKRSDGKNVNIPSSVLILAHSMGGMAVRAAPLLPNYQIGSIGAIVTLNTPHLAHPFGGDGNLEEFYERVNAFWMLESSWVRMNNDQLPQPTLSNIVIASIAGGSRDHVVRGDLTSLYRLTPKGRSIHEWTTSLPGVWIQMDHDAIVWCGQLIAVLSRAMISMHVGKNGMILSPKERLDAFDMALHGGNENNFIQLQPDISKTYRKRSVAVPQAFSHSFIGSRSSSLSSSSSSSDISSDVSDLSRGVCVPLPDSMSVARKESLVIVTDVAPFRSVVVSVCREMCSRGGRTNAHNWRQTKSSCRVLDDLEVAAMPHSRRRHHLHHSYDPKMHFGRERHHHRWSRVTSADLIDEAKYRHSGSIHTIVIDKEKLKLSSSNDDVQTNSVHIHFEHQTPYSKAQWNKLIKDKIMDINRRQQLDSASTTTLLLPSVRSMAIDEIGTFLQWSTKKHYHKVVRNNDKKSGFVNGGAVTDDVDWFLETQWFHDPEDLYLGNHMCDEPALKDKKMDDGSTSTTGSIFLFLVSLFTTDEWQAPAGHPWLMHIGACGIPYTRFTPQTLQVKRTGCTDHVPSRIVHDSERESVNEQKGSATSTKLSKTHFFAPIVHFSLLDVNGKEQESMMATVPPNGDDGPSYSYSLKGHDYSRPDVTMQLSIVMDSRCSYVISRQTDWFSTAEQLVLGLLPLWISAYHSTLVLILCLQLYRYRSHQEVPSIWVTARSRGIYVTTFLLFLSTARRWYITSTSSSSSFISTAKSSTMSSTSAISDDTRTVYIDIFLYATALAMVVVVNGIIIKLIVLLRLIREVFRIGVCGQGRGRAPGLLEKFCPMCCRLRCQRCSVASKTSVLQSFMESSGFIAVNKRLRKRSDSDVMTPNVDLQKALASVRKNNDNNNQRSHPRNYPRNYPSFLSSMQRYMKTSFSIVLLVIQMIIVIGVLVFSPMLLLICGTFILIASNALSTVSTVRGDMDDYEDDDERKVDEREEKEEEEPWIRHRRYNDLCAIPKCITNISLVKLYFHVRKEFFDHRVSYELTCSQLYLSVLVTRAPSILVAFLRFNQDYYLPLVYWDSILVFPFLVHTLLMVSRRDALLSRRWAFIPCVIALLTSTLGVLLYDRKMHRLPDLTFVLAISLCLLHTKGMWHSTDQKLVCSIV